MQTRSKFIVSGLGLVLALIISLLPTALTQGQAGAQPALAYINNSGNVYVTTLNNTTGPGLPVTQDANFALNGTSPVTREYTKLRWSPDGTKLAFIEMLSNSLYVSAGGQAPQLIATGLLPGYPVTWLPDSSNLVYIVDSHQPAEGGTIAASIQQVAASGGQAKPVASFNYHAGCGGGSPDPADNLYSLETELNGNFNTLAWTPGGWLYSPDCTGMGLVLTSFSNQQVWKIDNVARVAIAPSGTRAVGVILDANRKATTLAYIDLSIGRNTALPTTAGAEQVGWTVDESQVLYSSISGNTVNLWKTTPQGAQSTLLFSAEGRYIGVIASSPDSKNAVFSFVPSGDAPQTQILSTPVTGGPTNRATVTTVVQGGRPAFSPVAVSNQAANPATVTATPGAVACAPRADWTLTYAVAPGDTLASIARRANTTVDTLSTGNCLANANVIYVGQVIRVPVALPIPTISGAKRIVFPRGATSVQVQGQVGVSAIDSWVLTALGGQTMTVQINSPAAQDILIVWGADGTVLQTDHSGSSTFSGVLPSTQDYYLDVRGNPSVATSYTMTITVPPLVAPPPAATRIQFQPGAVTAVVQGQLAASGSATWVLRALAGQTMTAQLGLNGGAAILIVWGADGTVLQSDHAEASIFSRVLPSTQDYYIVVRNNPNTTTAYTLSITVPPR